MPSTSVIDQIMTAVVEALSASTAAPPPGSATPTPAPVPLNVNRFRTVPLENMQLPAMVVYPLASHQMERVGTEEAPVSDNSLTFWVECRASTTLAGGEPIDSVLDPLVVWALAALMNPFPPRFGGLITGLQLQSALYGAKQDGRVYGAIALEFVAHYYAMAYDATTAPT